MALLELLEAFGAWWHLASELWDVNRPSPPAMVALPTKEKSSETSPIRLVLNKSQQMTGHNLIFSCEAVPHGLFAFEGGNVFQDGSGNFVVILPLGANCQWVHVRNGQVAP